MATTTAAETDGAIAAPDPQGSGRRREQRTGSTAEPGPSARNGHLAATDQRGMEDRSLRLAERLGMYKEPSSSFPAVLPSDAPLPQGPTPNLLVDTDGLKRRVPNSLIDLVKEMEEADLNNPSDALLVLLLLKLFLHQRGSKLLPQVQSHCRPFANK